MNKKIVIKFKDGKVYAVGDTDKHHINCAYNALRVGDVQPTKRTKLKRTLKRLYKAFKYACSQTSIEGKRYSGKEYIL